MLPAPMPIAAACSSAATSALACRMSCTADSFVCAAAVVRDRVRVSSPKP